MPDQITASADDAVNQIIDRCAPHIKMFTPLGLGKPAQLINALYQRVKGDPSLKLTLFTALTLERPSPGSGLQKAFLGPIFERIFGDFVAMDYMADIRAGTVPDNIKVHEFFVKSGGFIGEACVQQNYISANYTHAARDTMKHGINVVAQIVAVRGDDRNRISMGCNPEVTLNAIGQAKAQGLTPPMLVGQVHRQLPYMENDAETPLNTFDLVLDNPDNDTRLFAPPSMPVAMTDYMIGLHASRLVPDGGTLQIGIGALGDAVASSLRLRHLNNSSYQTAMQQLNTAERFAPETLDLGDENTFQQGIYGSSEMFVDGFLYLMKAGVLKKHVYQDLRLQQWANSHPEADRNDGALTLTPAIFQQWISDGVVNSHLDATELRRLRDLGILNQHCRWDDGLHIADKHWPSADLNNNELLNDLLANGLCEKLKSTFMHGGFFLGPGQFYEELRQLSEREQRGINMTDIRYMNHLYDDEMLKRAQRQHGRFINTAFMVSLLGAATSDALENGQVVSGVGGQYNFVSQAHELDDGRSILMVKATREKDGVVTSNIVPHYGHVTIPRHLRDIYITEYGIADVRGKCDADVIKAMLNITDSRFQAELMAQAKADGKLETDYQIPEIHRHNTPERLQQAWQTINAQGDFPSFPFGSDFTPLEQQLGAALKILAAAKPSKTHLFKLIWRGYQYRGTNAQPFLERMDLVQTEGLSHKLERLALIGALDQAGLLEQRA